MKAVEIFQSIVDNVVQQAASGVWYLEPLWMLDPGVPVDDAECMAQVKEMLELTVKKKNAESNLMRPVIDWLYNLFKEENYIMENGEMKLMEDMMEYMKLKPEEQKRKEGWSFAKKD